VVSWDDSRQKGSKPAQIICEWLIVTIALRDIAVKGRKMRPDIYERINTADSKANEEDLEDNNSDVFNEEGLTDFEGKVIQNRINTADSKANEEDLEDNNSDLDALDVDEEPEDVFNEEGLTDSEGKVIQNIDLN
jgi:hypothetical protein